MVVPEAETGILMPKYQISSDQMELQTLLIDEKEVRPAFLKGGEWKQWEKGKEDSYS